MSKNYKYYCFPIVMSNDINKGGEFCADVDWNTNLKSPPRGDLEGSNI